MSERLEQFRKLLAELPKVEASEDPEEQTRAVLTYVVQRVANGIPAASVVPADPVVCPNCGEATASTRSPYCGGHCREMAAFIRQFRTSFEDGVIFDPHRQVGMGQALWSLQGGGFPRRQTLVPEKVVAKVLRESGAVCAACGAPATGVDHSGSACNRPTNLRAVCSDCNRGKLFGQADADLGEATNRLFDEVALRIGSEMAIRCCDDAKTWDWRAFVKARRP